MTVQILCGLKLHLTGELFGDFLCPLTALEWLHFLESVGSLSEVAVGLTGCLWLRPEVVLIICYLLFISHDMQFPS